MCINLEFDLSLFKCLNGCFDAYVRAHTELLYIHVCTLCMLLISTPLSWKLIITHHCVGWGVARRNPIFCVVCTDWCRVLVGRSVVLSG